MINLSNWNHWIRHFSLRYKSQDDAHLYDGSFHISDYLFHRTLSYQEFEVSLFRRLLISNTDRNKQFVSTDLCFHSHKFLFVESFYCTRSMEYDPFAIILCFELYIFLDLSCARFHTLDCQIYLFDTFSNENYSYNVFCYYIDFDF